MPSRRDFLLGLLAAGLYPAVAHGRPEAGGLSWEHFLAGMDRLGQAHADQALAADQLGMRGLDLLHRLDTTSPGFLDAAANAWESGNRFWLWQRLTREGSVLGGILHVAQGEDVPLHDHPGATGMLRVLSGELELWQYDAVAGEGSQAVLQRTSHRVLRPGDTALLLPEQGNIHALRAHTRECSMLDYFIPPYERRARSWYEPSSSGWRDLSRVACKRIHESDYYASRRAQAYS